MSLPRILIIDDDPETLKILKIALEKHGFDTLTGANWEEITHKVDRTYQLNRKIDLVILDLMMPERSGFDIFRALKVIMIPMPPVIVLSAVTGIEQQIQARDLGIKKYITKPTTPSKLVQMIEDVLAYQE